MKRKMKFKTPAIFFSVLYIFSLITGVVNGNNSTLLLSNVYAQTNIGIKKLPDFSKISNVNEKKEAFFSTLYPIIQAENNHVLQLRKLIVMLKDIPVKKLSAKQQAWLLSVSKKYKLENQYINNNIFEELLKRVDYVPPSLALTQAAIESGWGSSRFARQGNNLFGQWLSLIHI